MTSSSSLVRLIWWRIIDRRDYDDSDSGLFKILQRIKDILEQNKYKLVNLSIGPSIPIEDDEPHVWTTVLDKILCDGKTLLCSAAGNDGELDWETGNARIQPPSDVVNGLGVGSANSRLADWNRATYSCIGPGRRPGFIKPDILAFGGCDEEPFGVLDSEGKLSKTQGTSFASPYAARMAMYISTFFEYDLNAVALKALMIHHAESNGSDSREVGWGKIPEELSSLIASSDHQIHVLYQGILQNRAGWKLPVPIPQEIMGGLVSIRATFCFATTTDASHPLSYTNAGMQITFRPDHENNPNLTKSFFKNEDYWPQEIELRTQAMKWEPVMKREKKFRGTTLLDPVFELHYLNRKEGHSVSKRFDLPYAAVITVTAPKVIDLYNQIVNRYRLQLEPLKPRLQVQQRIRV